MFCYPLMEITSSYCQINQNYSCIGESFSSFFKNISHLDIKYSITFKNQLPADFPSTNQLEFAASFVEK